MNINDPLIKLLQSAGFVHATGLPENFGPDNQLTGRPISAHRKYWGMTGSCHGVTTAVLPTGEVWISAADPNSLTNLLGKACPKGFDGCAFTANGSTLNSYHVMKRMGNPFWHGEGNVYEFHHDPDKAEYACESWTQEFHEKQVELAREQGKAEALESLRETRTETSNTVPLKAHCG